MAYGQVPFALAHMCARGVVYFLAFHAKHDWTCADWFVYPLYFVGYKWVGLPFFFLALRSP